MGDLLIGMGANIVFNGYSGMQVGDGKKALQYDKEDKLGESSFDCAVNPHITIGPFVAGYYHQLDSGESNIYGILSDEEKRSSQNEKQIIAMREMPKRGFSLDYRLHRIDLINGNLPRGVVKNSYINFTLGGNLLFGEYEVATGTVGDVPKIKKKGFSDINNIESRGTGTVIEGNINAKFDVMKKSSTGLGFFMGIKVKSFLDSEIDGSVGVVGGIYLKSEFLAKIR